MRVQIEDIKNWSKLDYPLALNSYQFRLLGMGWPPEAGWIHRILGMEISGELNRLLCELRGRNKLQRKIALGRFGISASKLFHKKLRKWL